MSWNIPRHDLYDTSVLDLQEVNENLRSFFNGINGRLNEHNFIAGAFPDLKVLDTVDEIALNAGVILYQSTKKCQINTDIEDSTGWHLTTLNMSKPENVDLATLAEDAYEVEQTHSWQVIPDLTKTITSTGGKIWVMASFQFGIQNKLTSNISPIGADADAAWPNDVSRNPPGSNMGTTAILCDVDQPNFQMPAYGDQICLPPSLGAFFALRINGAVIQESILGTAESLSQDRIDRRQQDSNPGYQVSKGFYTRYTPVATSEGSKNPGGNPVGAENAAEIYPFIRQVTPMYPWTSPGVYGTRVPLLVETILEIPAGTHTIDCVTKPVSPDVKDGQWVTNREFIVIETRR